MGLFKNRRQPTKRTTDKIRQQQSSKPAKRKTACADSLEEEDPDTYGDAGPLFASVKKKTKSKEAPLENSSESGISSKLD